MGSSVTSTFQLGLMKISGTTIPLESIQLTMKRKATERNTSDAHKPKEILKGSETVDFTIKKAWDEGTLVDAYSAGTTFAMVVYNNDVTPPKEVAKVEGCVLSQVQIDITGDKEASINIQGKAISVEML